MFDSMNTGSGWTGNAIKFNEPMPVYESIEPTIYNARGLSYSADKSDTLELVNLFDLPVIENVQLTVLEF